MRGKICFEETVESCVVRKNRSWQRTVLDFQSGNNGERRCYGATSKSAEVTDCRYFSILVVVHYFLPNVQERVYFEIDLIEYSKKKYFI